MEILGTPNTFSSSCHLFMFGQKRWHGAMGKTLVQSEEAWVLVQSSVQHKPLNIIWDHFMLFIVSLIGHCSWWVQSDEPDHKYSCTCGACILVMAMKVGRGLEVSISTVFLSFMICMDISSDILSYYWQRVGNFSSFCLCGDCCTLLCYKPLQWFQMTFFDLFCLPASKFSPSHALEAWGNISRIGWKILGFKSKPGG